MSLRELGSAALVALLATIAIAGLFTGTSTDLRPYGAFELGGVWLLPGVIMVGACVALVIGDAARAAIVVVAAAVGGSTLYGLAIAAPGWRVEPLRVTLIDRGTTFGLVALLLSGLFGMAGLGVVWLVRALLGGSDF